LHECFLGTGWQLVREEVIEDDSETAEEAWDYIESRYTKPDGTIGFSVYCNFDERGKPVRPRIGSIPDKLLRLLQRSYAIAGSERHFQVQVWMASPGEISEEEREMARELLIEARERFREFIVEEGSGQ
jgi:uncharacterized protein YggL (DUF469 family)